jgi:hypothetical protein
VSASLIWKLSTRDIAVNRAAGTVLQRGSWMSMGLMVAIFVTKYAVAVLSAIRPELAHSLAFAAGVTLLFGVFNGLFLGRLARAWRPTCASLPPWPSCDPCNMPLQSSVLLYVGAFHGNFWNRIACAGGDLLRRPRDPQWPAVVLGGDPVHVPAAGQHRVLCGDLPAGPRLQHGARKAVSAAARTLDPGRELREAREAYDFTPTAQNQMRLASALLAGGQPEEAASTYEACLNGPFANDLEIRLGAARATLASSRPAAAVAHLQAIRAADAGFRPEQVALLLAQALAGAGRHDERAPSSNRRWAASTVLPCRRNMRSGRPAWAMPTRPTSCMATCSAPWSAGHAIRAT